MSRPLRVGSLFAGIGGFDLGFERAGFEVAWCVEWDKRAQSVLRRRFPQARIFGDITKIDPLDPFGLETVDVICGGFPCQDVSVAGKRAGLAGERTGLFHHAVSIVRSIGPSLVVLENVPGLLSSNRGRDFAAVIREMGEGWDCAEVGWRILDSQYFGVPQRRRRVFLVAGTRVGCAESVLALSESVSWHPAPRAKARKDATADPRDGVGACGERRVVGSLCARDSKGVGNQYVNEGKCLVVSDTAKPFRKSKRAQTAQDNETWVDAGVSNTLNAFDVGESRTTHAIAFHPTQDPISSERISHALGCGSSQGCATVAVAVDLYNQAISGDSTATLSCTGGGPRSGPSLMSEMSVRRLTPTECERLQGFPDGWTDGQPDTARYKQLGNAVTVNVAEWIARRCAATLNNGDAE